MYINKPVPKTVIKPDPIEKEYLRYTMQLHRPGRQLREKNSVCFRVDAHLSKPEIKQILQKLYGFDIKKVNVQRRAGLKKLDETRSSFLTRIYH